MLINPALHAAIPLYDGVFLCDNSTLEYIVTCPRSALFYLFYKRESSKERAALIFGDIIHQALEVRYRALQDHGARVITDDLKVAMLAKVAEGFSKWTPDVDEWRTYDCAVGVIHKYCLTYPMEDGKVLAVERPFAKPLGTITAHNVWVRDTRSEGTVDIRFCETIIIPIVWTGRLDLVLQREERIYIRDHKTTSIMGPTYFKEFELSSQFTGYGWATSEELGVLPHGFEINALGIRKPTRTGVPYDFQRQFYPLYQSFIDDWKLDVLSHLTTLFSYASDQYFPKATKACQGKYGECQYKFICSLPTPASRLVAVTCGEYRDVEWSPLADRSTPAKSEGAQGVPPSSGQHHHHGGVLLHDNTQAVPPSLLSDLLT